ncbi:MAG: tetratricopeptide repeat protein [Verrucomicrobiota bacterium]
MLFRLSRGPSLNPVTIVALIAATATTLAQQSSPSSGAGSDLAQLYSRAIAEFQAGDYAKAAADLDGLLTRAEFSQQLEPAFFTLGSAYFNGADYKKAIDAFKKYQAKFPNGPHTGDATFGIAQANLLTKNYAEAAAQFGVLEKDQRYRDQALFFAATTNRDAGKNAQAISILEKLTVTGLKTPIALRGATLLAQLYVEKGDADKTIGLIKKIHERLSLVDNMIELNTLTVRLGDQLFEKNLYDGALECYLAAYPRELLIQTQNDRLTRMQQRMDDQLAVARRDPAQFGQLATVINQLKIDIARTRKLLTDFEKLPSITPGIYLRMARSYYETDHKWESVVVYQELMDRFPQIPERESALFGLIVSLAEVNQPKKAQTFCEQYLSEFKTGPNAEAVGYMLGAVALQANDAQTAETRFAQMLESQPESKLRDQMRYLLGNAKFMQGKYDEAIAEYRSYLKEFPNGQNIEDVKYRIALTALFSGNYRQAMDELHGYIKKYPHGHWVSDSKYRLAVCKYAASLYTEVITDCNAWENEFKNDRQLGEVLALRADASAASDQVSDAIDAYVRSYKAATTDEVMNYSLFAASKLFQKRGEWDRVAELFQGFIENKPDSPTFLSALYWVGNAKAHEGKLEEARQITADAIKKNIADPRREKVELLLTQMAQLCVKKSGAGHAGANAEHVPSEGSPTPPPVDPNVDLDALLGSAEKNEGKGDQSAIARARILFAKAELARLRRQPAEEEGNIARLAEAFKPEELSPLLLGRAGDNLLSKQKTDQATRFYQRLMDEFPKSEFLDFAYCGLGEIALQKRSLTEALHYFSDGTEKIHAGQKMKDLTVGKAKTLLAMNKLEEAQKAFEQVAAVREWRGESTAFSMYSLGEIEAKRGHWAEANIYFQRVYVAYRKFLPWVAKAYMRSAESFEKLGKQKEAANTYRELLRNDKLADFAEAAEARKRLEALDEGS